MHSGALQKLYFTVGYLAGALQAENYIRWVRYIPVRDWKGQLPKQLTTLRINRRYGLELNWRTKENNVADAIGIGHYWLKRRKPTS
jgi:hypothetical protein